ncbi:nucleotide exchange factor GrpE [Candidatus Woesearchaeota archaeon]|nr:nucleotide exchange factor GrpE [Candidatus Woesearchaeota archaeon]
MEKSAEKQKPAATEHEKPAAPIDKIDKNAPEMEKQLADYKDSLQRLQAEFENYKKRVEKEKIQFRQYAAAEFVKNLLPVLDSFELALKSIANGSNNGKIITVAADDKIARGLELIYGQFYSVLEAQGLVPIKVVGEKFDPYKHEVLMQEETADETKDGKVIEEFQRGYMFNGAVLRYSKVKVLKFISNDDSGGK